MKKSDAPEFGKFMAEQALVVGRDLHPAEIQTWFAYFKPKRVTLEDFKLAWAQHKKDPKRGAWFPELNDLDRVLRTTDEEGAVRDWRCSEEVNGERCGFPGGIRPVGQPWQCSAHYRLGSSGYTTDASLQIITLSRDYVPPKNAMEHMERGTKMREESGARWREAHGIQEAKRRDGDDLSITPPPAPRQSAPDTEDIFTDEQLAEINRRANEYAEEMRA